MDMNRLNDMLERYGEVCTQKTAGKILNVVPRTISRMMEEGRLRRVGRGVDVRSICEYIENPRRANFSARAAGVHFAPILCSHTKQGHVDNIRFGSVRESNLLP